MSEIKFTNIAKKLKEGRIKRSQDKINQYPEIRALLSYSVNKEIVLSFRGCSSYGNISFEFKNENEKFKEILNKYHLSTYDNHSNIHIDKLDEFLKECDGNNIKLKLINFEPTQQPFWKIKKRDKFLIVEWNPITNSGGWFRNLENNKNSVNQIPGRNKKDKYYTIPLSEGWRLYEIHPEIRSKLCEWESVELVEEIKVEFEKRLRVKKIHEAEDSNVDYTFEYFPDFKLRPHQRVALEFNELIDHKSIIAYGTGTGKTSIAIADALKCKSSRNIVICPGALRLNWKKHIINHTGIEPITLAGRTPTKHDIKYLLMKKPKWVIINYDIIRTSIKQDNTKDDIFEGENRYPWVELINMYNPEYVIVDESHYIRNYSSNQSKAVRRVKGSKKTALSGTPIMNRPGELWSVLNWLHPELFPYYETFLRDYGYGRYIGEYETKQLRSLLETIMIKRTRADISKNLPGINRIIETFEMSTRARKIYDKILVGIYEELAEFDHLGEGGQVRQYKSILPKINAMIKVCAADKVDNTVERAVEIGDSIEEEKWNGVLIFTHFKGTCNNIARKLGGEALSFVNRTNRGFNTISMEERMKVVDQFQNDPHYKYLVATEGSAREGLDITKAGVVIFNDLFWTPAGHLQCEGRPFYRENDMHGGDSYYFQFENSIEEWITELQGIKNDTIQKIVEGKGIEHSVTNEIITRLREMFRKRVQEGS